MFKLNLSAKTRLLSGVSLIAIALTTPAAATTFSGLTGQSAATVATTIATKAPATTASTGSVASATAATTQSTTDLQNALATIKTQMAAQASAHAAAVSSTTTSTVTDGLSTNGLVVDPRVAAGTDANLWVNVEAPKQTTSSSGSTTVTIKQTDTRAIATWQSFNVGKNTTVYFDQSKGTTTNGNSWVVLNRVDATGSPSQILGQIKAEGTVILINPNGILFSGSSQVNTHSLIASSLDINSYSSTNYGVFNSSGSYTPITVDGVTQTTADGTAILAPANEESGNTAFLNNGAYASSTSVSVGGSYVSVPTLVLSAGKGAGSNAGVVVENGAVISTVDNVSGFDNGGYVALVGTSVSNAGSITTSAGQIILASGNNVLISDPVTATGATAFTVANAVPQGYSLYYWPAAISGTTTNDTDGYLLATRGNITLVGDTVDQDGVAEATTSITRPASIVITATGTTTFGADSLTAILPEENGETILANSLSSYTAPTITITTGSLDMASGSLIEAPGATMTVSNYVAPGITDSYISGRVLLEDGSTIDLAGLTDVAVPLSNYLYTFKVTANDVADTPEAKSLIGTTVTIDLSQSGTRADGEAWVGSPLFAATGAGYLGDVKESIDQLLTKAGSLSIGTFKDVLTQKGSLINLSGGWVSYTGANMPTTKLLTTGGIVVDIAKADYTDSFTGLAGQTTETSDRWVVSTTYDNGVISSGSDYVDGYIAGTNAGAVSLTAINPVIEGSIEGVTVAGAKQRANAQLPTGTALTITVKGDTGSSYGGSVELVGGSTDILGDGFTFDSTLTLPIGGVNGNGNYYVDAISADLLTADNLQSISIKGAYDLQVDKGASLTVRNGGSITLAGVTTVDGTLTAHAGTISLTGFVPKDGYATPTTTAVVIGADALLDVSGVWVNDTGLDNASMTGAEYINGGKVSITTDMVSSIVSVTSVDNGANYIVEAKDATQSIVLEKGSVIDLTSGGYVTTAGKLKYGTNGLPVGNGGSLSLITYAATEKVNGWGYGSGVKIDGRVGVQSNAVAPVSYTATVEMDGTIYAGGLNKDGSFTLQVPTIVIDGKVAAVTNDTSTLASDASSGAITTILPTSFFTDSGFGSFNLTSVYGGITVTDGTTLTLKQQNYQLDTDSLPATGAKLTDFASLGYAADSARAATNLSLTQYGTYTAYAATGSDAATAGVTLEEGASIVADPSATIALNGTGAVTVLGSIIDHGGSIAISSNLDIWIGSDALLDVSGIFIEDTTQTLYETGKVLDGGTITLGGGSGTMRDGSVTSLPYTNNFGAIVVLEGARFDLSGTSATIEEPTSTLTADRYVDKDIWSNGGTLTVGGASRVWFAGSIDAAGGSSSASGGTLVLSNQNIVVSQSGDVAAAFENATAPATASQLAALTGLSGSSNGYISYIAADTVNTASSGLDNVSLLTTGYASTYGGTANNLYFSGNVDLTVRGNLILNGNITLLPAGVTDIAYTTTACGMACVNSIGATDVSLNAGYIDWYSNPVQQGSQAILLPSLADGTLTLNATTQIDLMNDLSVSNAANVNLISGGDIRLIGTAWYNSNTTGYQGTYGALLVPGNLTLTAREIYPTSDASFTLMSLGLDTSTTSGAHNTITIASNGKSTYTPLSAGGAIYVDAQNIVQDGALIVPLGTIKLGFNSSDTLPSFYAWCTTTAGTACSLSTVATQTVTLGAGSLTQTSADGVYIPYGTTVSGADWTSNNGITLTAPPSQQLVLAGNTVTTESGATINENGGGDVYATEFVSGTGGTRDLRSLANTYALVPSYEASVAAGTSSTLTAGSAVTIAGGNGIAAGTYVLMPASYATEKGAYLVTIVKSDTGSAGSYSTTTGDGSVLTTATLTNTVTGAKSSSTALIKIMSDSVWTKYSEVDIAYGDTYFTALATKNGTTTPRLAEDAGQLTIAAAKALTLNSTNDFTAASGGRGGEVDITGTNLLVVSSDLKAALTASADYSNYIVLDADQLSGLNAESVLIGGTRSSTSSGTLITATAETVEVATDSAHALTGPELLLVSLAPTSAGTSSQGVVVDAGSVITAKGTVSSASSDALIIGVNPVAQYQYQYINGVLTQVLSGYTAGVSGDGSLLRVSNGGTVTITRNYVPGIYTPPNTTPTAAVPVSSTALGSLSVGAGATLSGTTIDLDSSGTTTLATDANLTAKNYDLAANVINVGGGTTGLVLSDNLITKLAGATSVDLRSASVINFYGDVALGTSASPIGTLSLDGAGLYSDGGHATIDATDIVLKDSQSTVSTANAVAGSGGSLSVTASKELSFGAGSKTLGGLSTASFTAGTDVLFTGSGSLKAGPATVTLTAPALIADTGAGQSLTTSGNLSIAQGTGTAPTLSAKQIGGAITFTAASIADAGTIDAQGGKVTLEATSGDVTLSGNAAIKATGTELTIGDLTEDTPAGTVKLIADTGAVTLGAGTSIDVSAVNVGYAGTLEIEAAKTATLDGTLTGTAKYNDLGASFVLIADNYTGSLPVTGFTGMFEVELGSGDITIAKGQTLTSNTVLLVTDKGAISVDGTIDASGQSAGTIGLYGVGGVTIGSDAKLYARYQADATSDPAYSKTANQNGGTITLGTSGKPDGTYNATYGYENVPTSGAISVASGALFDVSGGVSGSGGAVYLRAPILTNNNVNVSFAGTVVTNADSSGNASGNGIVLDAYAVWSTTDDATKTGLDNHFDGIIDPAGWYDSNGTLEPGTFTKSLINTNYQGGSSTTNYTNLTPIFSWDGKTLTLLSSTATYTVIEYGSGTTGTYNYQWDGTNLTVTAHTGSSTTTTTYAGISAALSYLMSNSSYAPSVSTNSNHVDFYQTVLKDFVNDPFNGNSSTVAADFSGAKIQVGTAAATDLPSTSLHLRPEIDLINPSTAINGGNITVASNWNLGSGTEDSAGNVTLYYRTTNGGEPGVLALLAANNVQINASVSDGFYSTAGSATITTEKTTTQNDTPTAETYYQQELSALHDINIYGVAYTDMVDNNGNITYVLSDGSSLSGNAIFGSYIDSSLLGPAALQKPTTFSNPTNNSTIASLIDQYAQYYYEYTQLYDVWAKETVYDDYYYIISSAVATYTPPSAPTSGSLYYNFSTGAQSGKGTDYVSQYENYFLNTAVNENSGSYDGSNFSSVVQHDGCLTCVAYAAPFAPAAVLDASLQAGYVATPPQVVTITTINTTTVNVGAAMNTIANNATALVGNTTTASDLMTEKVSGKGSFSYDIVAGAKFAADGTESVDPDAVLTAADLADKGLTGDVVVSGHTTYTDSQIANVNGYSDHPTIAVPTVLRTGTGSIAIAAAGNFELEDSTAVYTAGSATDTSAISDLSLPTLTTAYLSNPNGTFTTPSWGSGGGSITIAVNGDIVGNESASYAGTDSWGDWYYHLMSSNGSSVPFSGSQAEQTAAWVNYATFKNGIGALGGGNVSLAAGGNIENLIVSLPETLFVSGGTTSADAALHTFGGGNLSVKVGGDLLGSAFLVGDGTGLIQVTGSVGASRDGVTLQLGVQNGFISLIAHGDVTLNGIYDPAEVYNENIYTYAPDNNGARYLPGYIPGTLVSKLGTYFNSFSDDSGISLTSIAGDIDFINRGSNHVGNNDIAPTLELAAYTGDILIGQYFYLLPSSTGELSLIAGGSIDGNGNWFTMMDGTDQRYVDALGTANPTTLSEALHTGDDDPVLIYAGDDIVNLDITVLKPAKVWAGNDIIGFQFTGMNIKDSDITSIIAGGNIGGEYSTSANGLLYSTQSTVLSLYGPGSFLVEAGGDLGPFDTGPTSGGGIFSLGDGSNSSSTVYSYLPVAGADIYALWGVKDGIDYTSAINDYVNPANAGSDGISYLSYIADYLGVSQDKAWVTFEGLSAAQQQLLIDRAFAAFLAQVAVDYNDSTSAYYHKYARAYQTIATLFPATYGYTANNTGESNGAASLVHTGDLNMAHSLIETQTGGDIILLGPGGNAYVGVNSSDGLKPSQEGILTLQGGSILGYTDGSVEVYQSRIFTEQGGDIDLFSANGDLNAGKGVKSSASYPQLSLICDRDGYCRVSPAGLVTGAGIGALLSIPGQDPTKSNAVLAAPHGTVDAGAAGIRVAGNLNIVALYVANAFNIDVGGKTIGVPVLSTNLNLATVSNAATEATTILDSLKAKEPQNTIDVEVTGFGDEDPCASPKAPRERCPTKH